MSKARARPKLRIGFTGSRIGMVPDQLHTFYRIIGTTPMRSFHHGCCIGSDQQAFMAMYDIRRKVTVHAWPPEDPKYEALAWDLFCDVPHPRMPYLQRNKEIANHADLVIATPRIRHSEGGGTWWTVDYAISIETPVLLIYPDGTSTYR